MADTNMYMTLTYVDSKRLRCVTLGCKNTTITGKSVSGLLTLPTGHAFQIETYLCDECHEALANPAHTMEHSKPLVQTITKGCDCDACKLGRSIRSGGVPSPTCYCSACTLARGEEC